VYPHLGNAIANGLRVAEVSKFGGTDTSEDTGFRPLILEPLEPSVEKIGSQKLIHSILYPFRYEL